ncbi:hypothetical protein HMPREF9538_02955 [Klebsiella sp. MS 92-3]|nr:hypothetical protein HMPREF9538_02955 [Klebsiella sp. MS 92-3]
MAPEARRRLSPAGAACQGFRAAGSGRGSPLPGIAAAGINQGFVLSQDIAALWCKFHVLSP